MRHSRVTYRRRADIELREVGDEAFLIDERNGSVHHLNPTGVALWRLLADPMRLSEIVWVFCQAFPKPTRRRQKKMLKRLLEELEDNDLLDA